MTQLAMLSADATEPAKRGRCHVHFGDWREQEPDWPRPFVYVSDVPYGIAYKSSYRQSFAGRTDAPQLRSVPASIEGDTSTAERDAALGVSGWKAAAIFGPEPFKLLELPPWGKPRAILTWDKGGMGMGDTSFPWCPSTETIAIYGKGWKGKRTGSVLRGAVVGFSRASASNGREHPHQKPLNVVTELISKAPHGLPIVDPFMGSGTTAVACALLGREFYGAEIDPQYFDVIRGRLAAVGVNI